MRCFVFFQAEDGIRDLTVTGVQTCALPIAEGRRPLRHDIVARAHAGVDVPQYRAGAVASLRRSVAALAAAIVRAPTGAAAPHPRRRPARGRPGTRSTESPPPGCDHVRR